MIKGEWFEQRNAKYQDMPQWFISTGCLECFIWMRALAEKGHEWLAISVMSAHRDQYTMTLRSRLGRIWAIIRNRDLDDIEFDTKQDAIDFRDHLDEMIRRVWPE